MYAVVQRLWVLCVYFPVGLRQGNPHRVHPYHMNLHYFLNIQHQYLLDNLLVSLQANQLVNLQAQQESLRRNQLGCHLVNLPLLQLGFRRQGNLQDSPHHNPVVCLQPNQQVSRQYLLDNPLVHLRVSLHVAQLLQIQHNIPLSLGLLGTPVANLRANHQLNHQLYPALNHHQPLLHVVMLIIQLISVEIVWL
mgnify:CR=1 FL=1